MVLETTGHAVVKVGNKGVLPYALAICELFRQGNDTVLIQSRGKANQRALSAVMVANYLCGATVKETRTYPEWIEQGTEMVPALDIRMVAASRPMEQQQGRARPDVVAEEA